MLKFLANLFLPTEENRYRPRVLGAKATVLSVISVLALEAAFLSVVFVFLPGSAFWAAVLSSVLVEETNKSRSFEQYPTLTENPTLIAAAQAKAKDMATRGYFAHDTPEGLTPWYWLEKAGYDYRYAGENLAVNFVDSKDVVDAWLDSPLHRANILNEHFTEIGIATAEGEYQGRRAVFVVQFFGTPASQPAVPVAQAEAPALPSEGLEERTLKDIRGASQEAAREDSEGSAASATPPVVTTHSTAVSVGWLERLVVQPHTFLTYILFGLLALFGLAVILKIFVRIRIQYPVLIANGVAVVTVLGALLVMNDYVALSKAMVF